MAISVGVAFGVALIYMLLLRYLAGVMVFVSMVSILAVIAGGGYWVYAEGRYRYD